MLQRKNSSLSQMTGADLDTKKKLKSVTDITKIEGLTEKFHARKLIIDEYMYQGPILNTPDNRMTRAYWTHASISLHDLLFFYFNFAIL